MQISIIKRKLTEQELDILIEEVKKFFSPIVGYKDKWKQFDIVYIAIINDELVGVCGVEEFHGWLMLHPFLTLEKYHGKGIGSLLMKSVIDDKGKKNIFIGSQNAAVAKITAKYQFRTIKSLFVLPLIVSLYLLKFTIDSLNVRFIRALIQKRSMKKGKFLYFIRESK